MRNRVINVKKCFEGKIGGNFNQKARQRSDRGTNARRLVWCNELVGHAENSVTKLEKGYQDRKRQKRDSGLPLPVFDDEGKK